MARENGDGEAKIGVMALAVTGLIGVSLGYWYIVEKPKRDAQINQMNAISKGIAEGKIQNVSVSQADVKHTGTNVGMATLF
jgi:hypothetical protein